MKFDTSEGNSLISTATNDDSEQFGYFSTFMVHGDALYAEIAKARDRMVKNQVDLANAGADCRDGGCDPSATFLDLFEAELNRVSDTISAQQEGQELSAKSLLTNIDAIVKRDVEDPSVFASLRHKADEVGDQCLKLQRFVSKNAEILREIASYADSELGTSSLLLLRRRFAVSPWKEGPNSALVVVLSDIYETIRSAEAKSKSKGDKWVAPESFERSTTKYWIQEDKLTDLLLAAVTVSPLLVYGRSGHLTQKAEINKSEGDKLWDSLATPISSVYFDSPKMDLYRERIKRAEGAQLFRVRWYGPKPSGDEKVFLELKTHHEKWINTKSIKERVTIKEKDMRRFLSSKNWSPEVAKDIVLGGTPTMSGEKLDGQVELITQMHDLVIAKDLRPCVRSMYVRAAFQSPTSNDIRLTLDRNVTLIDETRAPRGSWCLPDDAVIGADMVARVPYPVFEIKLSDSAMPDVFVDLENRGVMMEAPKFSKYISGAAAFNADKIDNLPYWAEEPAFGEFFAVKSRGAPQDNGGRSPRDPTLKTMSRRISQRVIANTKDFEKVSQMFDLEDKTDSTLDEDENTPLNSVGGKSSSQISDMRASAAVVAAIEREKSEKSIGGAVTGMLVSPFLRFRGSGAAKESTPAVRPKRPARVEPKSYFANERTFIQWISAALLLVTISVILLDFQSGNNVPATAGIALVSCAVFIVFYSMFTYYRRLKLLASGSPYGYVDHIGPLILATAVLIGVVMLLYYYIETNYRDTSSSSGSGNTTKSTLRPESGLCFQHPTNGTSGLQYQPSDVAIDVDRDLLMVPSLQAVTALSTVAPNTPVESLITIPEADLEGITYVGSRIFALSEGDAEPRLYELGWDLLASPRQLQIVNDWELRTNQRPSNGRAEGIAYIPDATGGGLGSLLVAGDRLDPLAPEPQDRGAIYIFNVPAVGNTDNTLTRTGTLNSNLINEGLDDSKIGSLYYFENVLYIMNDNDRVIRSWDIDSGTLLATTKLPRVGGGFNQQWEGLAIENRNPNNGRLGRMLQGGPTSSLVLHLTLDTPAQVWSFAVNEDVNIPGSLVFPSCAAAV